MEYTDDAHYTDDDVYVNDNSFLFQIIIGWICGFAGFIMLLLFYIGYKISERW